MKPSAPKTNVPMAMLLAGIGAYLMYWSLTQPCVVEPITQTALNQTAVISTPGQVDKLLCLSTDYKLAIALLGGTILLWSGGSRLVDGLVDR